MTYLLSTVAQMAHWCQSADLPGRPAHAVLTSPTGYAQIDAGLIAVKAVVALILIFSALAILFRAFRANFWQRLIRYAVPALLLVVAGRELYQAADMLGVLLFHRGVAL